MDHLDQLEHRSVHILREAYANFKSLGMLWSIGKDSTVLLWLARKAFFGHVPFPLIHIDTAFKIPEMIGYRDRLALEWHLNMIYGQNAGACGTSGRSPTGPSTGSPAAAAQDRRAQEHADRRMASVPPQPREARLRVRQEHRAVHRRHRRRAGRRGGQPLQGAVLLAPERKYHWDVGDQPPEFWNQFKTEFAPGTHLRIHPLLDWTELNIWEYIKRENIPTVSLYYNQGDGERYRSLGCWPCTMPSSRTRGTWTTSSWSSSPASSPTSRSGRAARRTRTAAVGSRSCVATGTCERS